MSSFDFTTVYLSLLVVARCMVVRRRLVVGKREVAISGCRDDRLCLQALRGALRCKPRQKKAFCQDVTCLAINKCALERFKKTRLNQANEFPNLSQFGLSCSNTTRMV